MTQINRKLHEALGKCWHETEVYTLNPKHKICMFCDEFEPAPNPDYCGDPRLVLEAMRERYKDDEYGFSHFLFYLPIYGTYPHLLREFSDLIMDKTGKLALLALEWLGQQEGGK